MSKIILTNREIHCLDVTIRILTTVSWMIILASIDVVSDVSN